MNAVTFQRIYREHGPGLEYPASPEALRRVFASMNQAHASNQAPFRVRLRLADGSTVTVSPKKGVQP